MIVLQSKNSLTRIFRMSRIGFIILHILYILVRQFFLPAGGAG